MIDGEGTNVIYSYDTAGRLTEVEEGENTRGTYILDAAGKLTRLTYGNSSYAEYDYDGAGRLTVVNNQESDGTDISKFVYELDDAGLRRTMSISGTAYTSAACAYDYDSAYQLTRETRTGGNSFTESFYYDSAGNRTKKVKDAATTNYYYDYIDRMTKAGAGAMEWDYWGNLTQYYTHTLEYDDTDRVTKFDRDGSSEYDADYCYLPGSWKRYKRTLGGTTEYYVYDGANVVGSYTSGGTLNARYITPGLDSNLAVTQGANTYYYMSDGLGSIRNLVDASETTQNTYDYRAFGESLSTSENVTSPYRFTGREYEAGGVDFLHYYRNRYYNANSGIFASRDAVWADVHRGWGYVRHLPTMRTDPYGLGWWGGGVDVPDWPDDIPNASPNGRCPAFAPDDCLGMARNIW